MARKNSDGNISFTSDFTVIKPVEPDRGANRVLVELPNRGRKRVVDTMNRTGKDASGSPDPGDGFLFERGVTVASLGWQWDVYGSEILMGLNPPIADFSEESNAGKTVVEIRPNHQAKTWLLADRVHKPLRVKDVYSQDASLYLETNGVLQKKLPMGLCQVMSTYIWRVDFCQVNTIRSYMKLRIRQ